MIYSQLFFKNHQLSRQALIIGTRNKKMAFYLKQITINLHIKANKRRQPHLYASGFELFFREN